jgi:hypothetical protein
MTIGIGIGDKICIFSHSDSQRMDGGSCDRKMTMTTINPKKWLEDTKEIFQARVVRAIINKDNSKAPSKLILFDKPPTM